MLLDALSSQRAQCAAMRRSAPGRRPWKAASVAKWSVVARYRSPSVNILSESAMLAICTTLEPSVQAQREVLQEAILQGRKKAASCGTGEPQVMGGPCDVLARPVARRTIEW